jgi:hypothetical protein
VVPENSIEIEIVSFIGVAFSGHVGAVAVVLEILSRLFPQPGRSSN